MYRVTIVILSSFLALSMSSLHRRQVRKRVTILKPPHDGCLRLSVAVGVVSFVRLGQSQHPSPTFKMEQHVRLVVLEHLSHELDVHVLNVDFLRYVMSCVSQLFSHKHSYLKALVQDHNSFVQLLLQYKVVRLLYVTELLGQVTYDIGDDTRQQLALLMFMWALLEAVRDCPIYVHAVIPITILDRTSSNECR